MERRVWIAAAVAALAGAGLLRWYVHRLRVDIAGGPSVRVLVVTRDAAAGAALTRDMLAERELPQAYLESRHVRARDLDQVLGAALAVPANAGEALLWTDLAPVRAPARSVSSLLAEGMRAVSLARASSGIDTLLSPGDRVDVLLVPERAGAADASAVRVAENLLVLAIGSDTAPGATSRSREAARRGEGVTVSATPEQSLKLAAAERSGVLRLVLRNPDDIAITGSALHADGASHHLPGGGAPPAPERRP